MTESRVHVVLSAGASRTLRLCSAVGVPMTGTHSPLGPSRVPATTGGVPATMPLSVPATASAGIAGWSRFQVVPAPDHTTGRKAEPV